MLHRYDIPSDPKTHEGWAVILLDTHGLFFAAVSDYGNYAYMWTDIGHGNEFRKFLAGLEPDYLYGKLMSGRPDIKVYDGDLTKVAIRDAIEEMNKAEREVTGKDWTYYKRELEFLEEDFDTRLDFERWSESTELASSWELAKYVPEPQCTQFCTKTFALFKQRLTEELRVESGYGLKPPVEP